MEKQALHKILAHFGIVDVKLLAMQTGYRNQNYPVKTKDELLNLIIYKHEVGILRKIRNAHAVSAYVVAAGMPARRCYDQRIMVLKSSDRTRYAALYYYLPGTTISWEAYTMEHLKALGGALGTMHTVLRHTPRGNFPEVHKVYAEIVSHMDTYFKLGTVREALRHKLRVSVNIARIEQLQNLLEYCGKLPNQQPLHMDFVRGNILFQGKAVSGVLDFEKTAWGHPLFDIARTLAFLIVDCKYKDEDRVRKYFLQSGYNKRGGIDSPLIRINGKSLLDELTGLFLLHDFYKFLRHNPYEALESNEHFVRTRAILLKRSLITPK